MVKKFGYKTPTIVALTLAGTAFSAHQANAAEQVAPEKHLRMYLMINTH